MIRHTVPMFVALLLLAVRAQAADNSSYAATAEATQSADKITMSIKLVYKEPANAPKVGQTEVTTTLGSPKVVLFEGQRAQVAIGKAPSTASATTPQAKPEEMESGYKVDIISVKGRDEIIMVTTVIEHRQVVWADATTVHIVRTPEPAGTPK